MITAIYKHPCKPCPSIQVPDPMTRDIRSWPKDAQKQELFVCYIRRKKLCKGLCDNLGITEKDFENDKA